jgi:16S rRNA (uracil1498-N3)-methyltransferase
MRRFLVEKDRISGNRAFLKEDEARHIGKVLRLGVGDTIYLLDEEGSTYHAMITARDAKTVEVEIVEKITAPKEPALEIVLGQAIPKAQKMDLIVQKATELGISSIIPFLSDRSVPLLDAERSLRKRMRWQKVAAEATMQCGRTIVPQVDAIIPFRGLLNRWDENSLKIMLWEDEKNSTLKDLLKTHQPSTRVVILVGPEGGFSGQEVAMAREAGFHTVSLGKYILRTETVGMSLLSIVHYEWEM